MRYVDNRPGEALRPHLECVWVVADRARARRTPERVVPDGCPELIVHLGDPYARRVGGGWRRQPRAFLAGTLTRPWLLRPGRRVLTLGVRFRPGEVRALLPVAMPTAAGRETTLASIVGAARADALTRALQAARGDVARFAAAEAWLLDQLERVPSREPGARPAVRLLLRARGTTRIAAGYFDQAHLLRDVRTLAGRGPRSPRAADGELVRHFTDPARLRLLLAGD